jgi:hypothetical protein
MKALLIVAAIVLLAGSGLAAMNSACKSTRHVWCSPLSSIRQHVKPPADRVSGSPRITGVWFQSFNVSVTGFRTTGKAVERPTLKPYSASIVVAVDVEKIVNF